MDPSIQETWKQLVSSAGVESSVSALTLAIYLFLGGLMALYVRALYRHCGSSASDSDSITRIFPLLTMVTIGVISVVKSSMALSLGLVGALSIVRFRAAIKEPEELVYLFLCIGIGLAMGANQPLLAVILIVVASCFILGMHYFSRGFHEESLLLTITGDSSQYFAASDMQVLQAIESTLPRFTIQRMDVENGRGQIRLLVRERKPGETVAAIANLRERLPQCDISFVNLKNAW